MKRLVAIILALACVLAAGCGKIDKIDENKEGNTVNDIENPAVPASYCVAEAAYPEMAS